MNASPLTTDEVGELLDEVERVRAEVVVAWEFCDAGQAVFDAEYATNKKLRARLAALGKPELQQRVIRHGCRVSPAIESKSATQ